MGRGIHVVRAVLLCGLAAPGCYSGQRATQDVNEAWRGRTRQAIEARWGRATSVEARPADTTLRWTRTRHHVSLPSARGGYTLDAGGFDGHLEVKPGRRWTTSHDVVAIVGPDGRILRVDGPSLRRGPPTDANLRWGVILGMHAGFGRLDDTSTSLPSGAMYIGGMLGPQTGLVGAFSLVSGIDDAGGAMGFVWAMGVQWWADASLSVRGGPALVLAFEPGFEDVFFDQGVNGLLSYALIRKGSFVLDVRLDVTVARNVSLGSLGIGVNLN